MKQTSRMMAIKTCKNNRAIKFLNQALKNQLLLLLDKERIAKGAIIIKTFNII